MDPATIIAAFGALIAWLSLMQSQQLAEDKELRDAINAICEAAEKTRAYVAVAKKPVGHGDQPRDHNQEMELSNLWMRAGNLLVAINWQLGQRCEVKSGYWENPEKWAAAEIKMANIQLEDIYDKACELRRNFSRNFNY